MGWTDSHLHEFRVGRQVRIGLRDPEWDAPGEVKDERKVVLSALAPKAKGEFTYAYHFGDDGEHTVLVEKTLPLAPETVVPSCIAGKGACLPEDCGPVWGYAEDFDLEGVNQRLGPRRARQGRQAARFSAARRGRALTSVRGGR